MNPSALAVALSLGMFFGMLACVDLGYRIGRRHSGIDSTAHEGIGTIEAAIFALFGLLLGFAFAGAMSRLDARRQLIVQEANAIGTAYLRLDVLSKTDQREMRRLFRDYLEARLHSYDTLSELEAAERRIAQAAQLQQQIWARAVDASRLDPTQNITRVVLPALNEMIDVTTTRAVALRTHMPSLVFFLLIAVGLLSALLAGYAMAKRRGRSLLHMLLFAASVSITIYTVLDLDNPRFGLIRLEAAEKVLQQLHDSIR